MKTAIVEVNGVVTSILPDAMYRVQLDVNNSIILGYLCGKLRKRFVKLTLGDKVSVEMSPQDLTKGRISQRFT